VLAVVGRPAAPDALDGLREALHVSFELSIR
jgi:hypothetical protein